MKREVANSTTNGPGVYKKDSPLVLFGFEGQKLVTLLEHNIYFQRYDRKYCSLNEKKSEGFRQILT